MAKQSNTSTKKSYGPLVSAPGVLQQITFAVAKWPGLPVPGFSCLCDTGQFTVTGGYTKVNIVDVPQREGLTVFAGYDPITATIPLLFDMYSDPKVYAPPSKFLSGANANVTTRVVGTGTDTTVEDALAILEWMGGRGLPLNGIPSSASAGKQPPGVNLATNDKNGNPTNLIPGAYQYNQQNKTPPLWIITALDWGDSIRDASGNRQQQKVTVTLTEDHSNPAIQTYSAVQSFSQRNGTSAWANYTIKDTKYDTCRKIASNYLHTAGSNVTTVANKIQAFNNGKNGLSISHIDSVIPQGTTIKIPTSS